MQRTYKKIKVSKQDAERIYSNGGKIIIECLMCGRVMEVPLRYLDCGYGFRDISNMFDSKEYFVEESDIEASEMCDLMCS